MSRPNRFVLLWTVLLAVLAITVVPALGRSSDRPERTIGNAAEESDEAGELGAANTDRVVGLLSDEGIETDASALADLTADLGLGGAVRALAWADASGTPVDEIVAMRADGDGWGVIRRALDPDGELGLSSGIGWIMSGGAGGGAHANAGGSDAAAHGRPDNPGQQGQDRAAQNHEGDESDD
jgi:hypothetical protein